MNQYQKFLVEHIDTVATVENALRTLLFFMPGRLRDSQLKLETAYTALGLVSWFNDLSIINYLSSLRRKMSDVDTPSSPKKITEKEGDSIESPYFPPRDAVPLATWLTFLRFIELFIEMAAKSAFGKIYKYRAALAVESVKAVLKLWLLVKMKGRMLLQNYLYLPQLRDVESIKTYATEQLIEAPKESSQRKRLSVSNARLQVFKEQTGIDDRNQQQLQLLGGAQINPKSTSSTTAEVLNIVRPIVYLLSVLRFGEKSWLPLLASLGVDLTSLGFYYNSKKPLSEMQQFEVTRRSMLLSFYFLRNPIFKLFTL
ncbi:hypothetical protein PROFUN_11381 [Planoprotostelium fungivorum]|uniref:Peroxisomal membrane protein PEX16 n=1 Tax=Planoprotostelium fungivorum TaxID=1890364 RepID=A0A2P6N317_9EUKA|nr:hypothetical protein PROFUN_11381 [Planoprotostelium fungivorum]